jgi:Na+-driven multidrug efflux pump
MVPLGSSVAACTLTGNFLGEGKPKMAKQFSETTLYFNQTVLLVISLSIGKFKSQLA